MFPLCFPWKLMISPSKMITRIRKDFWVTRTRIPQVALPLLLALMMTLPVNAQQSQKQSDSVSAKEQDRPLADSHSFMELFTKLENQWTRAVQEKDRSGLETLLAPEFIVHYAEDPAHPVLRDAWITDALAGPQIDSFSHDTMDIRAFMGVAIVSFLQKEQQKVNGKDRPVQYFVVDVWEVNHQHWQAAARYLTPVGSRLEEHHGGRRIR